MVYAPILAWIGNGRVGRRVSDVHGRRRGWSKIEGVHCVEDGNEYGEQQDMVNCGCEDPAVVDGREGVGDKTVRAVARRTREFWGGRSSMKR